MHTLGQIAVRARPLTAEDSLGRAAEAVRASTVGAAPVVDDGRLVGLITSAVVADAAARTAPGVRERLTVASLPLQPAIALPAGLTAQEALQVFQANDLEHAPVLDSAGCLVGMVSRADLATAVCGRLKPPIIGGMATPFGVYLTGGGVRGGVGDLALMSTGAYLAVLQVAALLVADWLFGEHGRLLALVRSAAGAVDHLLSDGGAPFAQFVENHMLEATMLGVFAMLFRLSTRVAGYHAAEHQVVHALEAGDDLRPEVVARKPRVHPRCGTNLVIAVLIMSAFWKLRGAGLAGDYGVLLAMLVTFLTWRRVGGWVQQHVTTCTATPKQIAGGIFAGRQLMERYQQRPNAARHPLVRIWNMGLLQVMLGGVLVIGMVWLAGFVVPLPEILRAW